MGLGVLPERRPEKAILRRAGLDVKRGIVTERGLKVMLRSSRLAVNSSIVIGRGMKKSCVGARGLM